MTAIEFGSTSLRNDANLKAYYKLENVNDDLGVNNLLNTASVPFNAAQFNNGADMGVNNISKFLDSPTSLSISGGALSMTFWIKLQSNPASGSAYATVFQGSSTNNVEQNIIYRNNAGTPRLEFTRTRVGVADDALNYNYTLSTSVFHHLAYTYDGTNLRGYVDGLEVAGSPISSTGNGSSGASDRISIGATYRGSAGSFGSEIIDDVTYFNRALTANEVSVIALGGSLGGSTQRMMMGIGI